MADDDYTIGDLARQDIYPDERGLQPPVDPLALPPEAYASLGGGDLGLLGNKGIAGLFGRPSWMQRAQDLAQKDVTNYQTGGVPAMMGDLAADSSAEQVLAGGFGGNIKGVKPPIVPGALAALGEYHPPFYSAVERAVQDAKQNVAPGQQWAGYLRNQPGVKPEEVETLGLGRLFEQPTVPKQAMLDQIAANKVNVGEVMKGVPDPSAAALEKVAQERYGTSLSDPYLTEGQRMAIRDEAMHGAGDVTPTKFSSYTLPGGENYREMLLTLPDRVSPDTRMMQLFGGIAPEIRTAEDVAAARKHNPNFRETFKDWDDQRVLRAAQEAQTAPEYSQFKSSHFDEPNVLAHVRYNDRVIDGKKTLFVEEVQSDWHQAGKRKGYIQPPEPLEDTSGWTAKTEKNNEFTGQRDVRVFDADGNFRGLRSGTRATDAEIINAFAQSRAAEHPPGQVPDAPFKTTWPDLAMKRVIREAAEKGYDKVAWTPGSVQADRYDLSKHISKIAVRAEEGGEVYNLKAHDLNGGEVIDKLFSSQNELADLVGKDMAEKVFRDLDAGQNHTEYKGLDLKVGGEGMKGFYDQILPATVNKLVKKHGSRVEQGKIVEENPKLTLDTVAADMGFGGWHSDLTAAQKEMVEARWEQRRKFGKETGVHTIDITPSLRAAAMKGFPLFTAGGIAATGMMGDLAKQDDYQ